MFVFLIKHLKPGLPPQAVDRLELPGRDQPGSRVIRDAGLWPLLQRGTEGVLKRLLRDIEVPQDANQRRKNPARL